MKPYDRELELPRITSTHRFGIYEIIKAISDQIDFRNPVFRQKHKRNRSLGSVQAFIVELALGNDSFRLELKKYMINNGKDWKPTLNYLDRYF